MSDKIKNIKINLDVYLPNFANYFQYYLILKKYNFIEDTKIENFSLLIKQIKETKLPEIIENNYFI